MHWITQYTRDIAAVAAESSATELSYRTPIETMLQSARAELRPDVVILQEPSRESGVGAPDFRISARSGGIIGYIECKKPNDDLARPRTKKQIERYRALSDNIIVTDSWSWFHVYEGNCVAEIRLSEQLSARNKRDFIDLLRGFFGAEVEKIGDSKRLAVVLARRCALLRDGLKAYSGEDENTSQLHGLCATFRTMLDIDLTFDKFADTFAQTIVYSLLLAKLQAPANKELTLANTGEYIPTNFSVIGDIALFLSTLTQSKYQKITWVMDDILATINAMDVSAITQSMSYLLRREIFDDDDDFGDDEDPYIYFYEHFLAVYDPQQRERRGVYYTPSPVVKFIVRAVDDLLRRDFRLAKGLAETDAVTALDFAAGTGTFMLEMFRRVLKGASSPAERDLLARGHLLKNFFGFELLMAPYIISHLKLSQYLAEEKVPLKNGERINVFLTNTLEKASAHTTIPLLPNLAEEANRAQEIKDSPVLVITGNPPYSVKSQNTGNWITGLIEDYKKIDEELLDEGNLKVLLDDYVKFIRFAQFKMERVERGIVAVITNHSFLDNPTFRGMRKSLLDAFDAIYILDLHGNTNREEVDHDGNADKNVFDIRMGVAVSVFVKNSKSKNKGVFYDEFYGKRNSKYSRCAENSIETLDWTEVTPDEPFYLFIPHDTDGMKSYFHDENFYSVNDMFIAQSTGIKTHRDHFAYAFDVEEIKDRISKMIDEKIETEALKRMYNIQDTQSWNLDTARKMLIKKANDDVSSSDGEALFRSIKPCAYRPFDVRQCCYGDETMDRSRSAVMNHMISQQNICLATVRQVKAGKTWQHCLVTDMLADTVFVSNKTSEVTYIFPLYQQGSVVGEANPEENFTPEFRKWIDERYGKSHSPESILACIYAILHSPDYRARCAGFLRWDFPRIPFPDSNEEFERLATIGNELINAHLLRENCHGDLAKLQGPGDATHRVEDVRHIEARSRLHINQVEFFEPVPPQVFNFKIGGYLPLDKYLKSRKGRALNLQDVDAVAKIANAIAFTMEKSKEIDP